MADNLFYTTHHSAIGKLLLVASPRGMRYITLIGDEEEADTHFSENPALVPTNSLIEVKGFFASAILAIDHYLAHGGPLKLPADLVGGTPLQRAVWLEIARIPYGETISYTELAERVGFPRAVRAVASACGANPLPLIIPCHRVLAKDGSLGGFSLGGVDIKEFLLLTESQKLQVAA